MRAICLISLLTLTGCSELGSGWFHDVLEAILEGNPPNG